MAACIAIIGKDASISNLSQNSLLDCGILILDQNLLPQLNVP